MMEQLVPKLRFPEFKEKWSKKLLKECVYLENNKRIPLKDINRSKLEKIYPYYGASGIIDYVDNFIFNGEYILLGEDGANILTRSTKLCFIAKGKFWVNNHAHVFKAREKFSNYYLCEYLENLDYAKYNSGTAQPKINSKTLSEIPILFPSLEEQTKIADFLGAADKQLDILNQKKEKLNTYKKGVMQQLFSQQIRFKDDNGNNYPDWEEKCFDEIFESVPTKKHQIKSSEYLNEGVYPIVDQGQKFIVGFSNEKEKVFKTKGSIIFGDHTTILKYIDFNFIIGADGVKVLQSKTLNDIKFLYYNLSFNNVKSEGYKRHYSILKELKLHIPSIEEQTKIANFLSAIDRQIETVSAQIEKTENYKKGLLQQMFV